VNNYGIRCLALALEARAWLMNAVVSRDLKGGNEMRRNGFANVKLVRGLALASLGFLFSGCSTTSGISPEDTMLARFVVESDQGVVLSMPVSGARIQVNPKAILTEYDLLDVSVVELDLGLCLQFSLSHQASRAFYQTSASNQGRRLVLLVNGKALGLRRIDRPVSNGVIYVFIEMPDGDLPELAKNLRETSIEIQKKIRG